MNLKIAPETIINFIEDENLGPYRFKQRNDTWVIQINEPFDNSDTKFRLGIAPKIIEGKEVIVFNAFKSVANYGDDYKGNFYKFVKLVKDLTSITEAKNYFMSKYLFNANEEINFDEVQPTIKKYKELNFPDWFERLNKDNSDHKIYIDYLEKRKFPYNKFKIFIDKKDFRIIFPVYEQNDLIFYTGRAIYETPLTWKKSKGDEVFPIWNLENVNMTCILLEGIFDAGVVPNGVALLGAYWNDTLRDKILNKCFNKIIIVMDNDLPGTRIKLQIAKDLISYHKNIYIYNYQSKFKDFSLMYNNSEKFNFAENCLRFDNKAEILLLQKIKTYEGLQSRK